MSTRSMRIDARDFIWRTTLRDVGYFKSDDMYEDEDVIMEMWGKSEWNKCEYLLIFRYEIILQSKWGSMNDISEEKVYNYERILYRIVWNYRNNSGDEVIVTRRREENEMMIYMML